MYIMSVYLILGDNPLLDCQSLNFVDGEQTGSTMQMGNSKFHIFRKYTVHSLLYPKSEENACLPL